MDFLSKSDIAEVQASYQDLGPSKGFLTNVFYRRLFAIAPQARALFPEDMSEQMSKLESMLDFLVNNLRQPMFLAGKIKRLARRHVTYGAEPAHYELVGEALIYALDELTPGGLSHERKLLWGQVYGFVSTTMIDAAYSKAS